MPLKQFLPLLIVGGILCVAIALFLTKPKPQTPLPSPLPNPPSSPLSMLATPPDWSALEIYQNTIQREEFEELLTTIFTTGNAWKNHIRITETEAQIQTGMTWDDPVFYLRFAKAKTSPPRGWRATSDRSATTLAQPLTGLKIAIDPGHIGGTWAKIEERWFVVGDGNPVQEGDMTLQVAKLLKPRLEALGATVTLVRETLQPVTNLRPETLLTLAQASPSRESPQKLADRLFYRTAEIRARADLVNQVIKPDLVLCLHFNAEGWGDPNAPTLIDRTHLHLLLNGAYTDEEVGLADQRFAMLQKILQRTHEEEALVGATVAATFAEISGLPPYIYPKDSGSVRAVVGQPYLWIRNLIASRLYNCPVIYMEPYVMNSTIDYARIQADDYQGLREIDGKMQPSIFQEYADALAKGLSLHYSRTHKSHPPASQPDGR